MASAAFCVANSLDLPRLQCSPPQAQSLRQTNFAFCLPSSRSSGTHRSRRLAFYAQCSTSSLDSEHDACAHDSTEPKSSRRALLGGCVAGTVAVAASSLPALAGGSSEKRIGEFAITDAEWRARLDPLSYDVLRHAATERPFTSPLNNEKRKGVFSCAGCSNPLFSSSTKYNSGTGWPSFYAPVSDSAVVETPDPSLLWGPRTEVRCARCQGHLGHVFPDGPRPTGLRYCMNGAALVFKADA